MPDRLRTQAEIDLLNSYIKEGEPKLPYELDENNNPIEASPLSDEEKLEAEQKIKDDAIAAAKQKELDDAANEEKKKIIAADQSKNKSSGTQQNSPAPELDDEKILAYLKNKTGKEITSLDEFINPKKELTEEEKKAIAEQRDSNKIAYGLSKGLFSKKELETFITDTKNPKDLVYAAFAADQKEKDENLTDEEIETEFNEKFGLDAKEDSRQFKVGQNLINNIADNIIRKKHSKILNLDNEYTSYENSQNSVKETQAAIASKTPAYKSDIDAIRNEIKNISIPISENEVFETQLEDSIVNEIISELFEEKFATSQIKEGWNKETLKQVSINTAIRKQLPSLLKKYSDAQILKQQKGVRGVIPGDNRGRRITDEAELTEQQKQAISFMKGEAVVAN